MRNLWKRNQIMITALALMIVIAGYLNFTEKEITDEIMVTNSAQFEEVSTDGAISDVADLPFEETEEVAGIYDISDEDTYTEISSLDSEVSSEGADYLDAPQQASADTLYVMDELASQEGTENETQTPGSEIQDAGQKDSTESASLDVSQTEVANAEVIAESADSSLVDDVPGEAVFTSTTGVSSLASANLLKEQTRAKNKETLLEIINSTNVTEEAKQQAITSMIAITDITEKECATEILLEAKGFTDVVVSISGEMVDVMVGMSEISDAQRAQIEDIVQRKTGVSPENIIISPIVEN